MLDKILNLISSHNRLDLFQGSQIHSTVKLRGARIRGKVKVNEGCKIINGVTIDAESPLSIGRFTSLNGPNMDIICKLNPVLIGSFCSIARNVSIQEFNHKLDRISSYYFSKNIFKESGLSDIESKGPIEIGNDVWIGTQSVITSGVLIGDGAVVAANSVVTKNIPPYAVVAGSPAQIIRYRFNQDIIDLLLKLQWWNWPLEKIERNRELFGSQPQKEILQSLIN